MRKLLKVDSTHSESFECSDLADSQLLGISSASGFIRWRLRMRQKQQTRKISGLSVMMSSNRSEVESSVSFFVIFIGDFEFSLKHSDVTIVIFLFKVRLKINFFLTRLYSAQWVYSYRKKKMLSTRTREIGTLSGRSVILPFDSRLWPIIFFLVFFTCLLHTVFSYFILGDFSTHSLHHLRVTLFFAPSRTSNCKRYRSPNSQHRNWLTTG